MHYEKPGGAMHPVIRRAFEELRQHNNPQNAITIVTQALANADGLPPLPSGKEYNADGTVSILSSLSRPAEASASDGSGGVDIARPRSMGNPIRSNQNSANAMQCFTAGSVGVAITSPSPVCYNSPSATVSQGSVEWLNKRHSFNRTQILRLLLIRCEAFSALKQHTRALQDAEKAVEVSRGQSAEAYFNLGREQRRQFNIVEAASAFDTAEALLRSMQQAIASGKTVFDGWSEEASSDEVFWADRGFQMEEVRSMGITRREYETQEHSSYRNHMGNSFSGPTSPTSVNGRSITTLRGEPATPLSSVGRARVRHGTDGNVTNSFTMTPNEGQILQGSSTTAYVTPVNASIVCDSTITSGDESAPVAPMSDWLQFGMSPNELSMWHRLANESRALLAMRQSHTVPSSVLSSTMSLLDLRISGTRGGLVISIENNTHAPLRFVGALAPSALYHESCSFPDVISKAHCGVAMLHPRGWAGYSGSVCYELNENLCCFLYFESPLLGSVKYGVRFVDLRASDLRRAYAEVYERTGVYGIAGGTTTTAITASVTTGTTGMSNGLNFSGSSSNSNGGGVNGLGSAGRVGVMGVAIRGAATPLTTTAAGLKAARDAIEIPPPNTWVVTHTASSAMQRPVKASSRMVGGHTIALSLAEVLAVRLRSVELIPALEYVGAVTLKKISSVSRRYRELINNLPPSMFYGAGRRCYPDYCVGSDRYISPWIVRDAQPVTWKLVYDGRMADQEEFSISDENDMQKHILCFTADVQTKVTGYVYLGDKRCLQYIIKESWVPFSNTLYLTTPIGRTFASCVSTNNQTQYTLSLTSSSNQSGSHANGGGEDVLYTARKRVYAAKSSNEAVRTTPVPVGVVLNGDEARLVREKVSPSGAAFGQQTHSMAPTGVVDVSSGDGNARRNWTGHAVSAAPVIVSGTPIEGGVNNTVVGTPVATMSTSKATPPRPLSLVSPNAASAGCISAAAAASAIITPTHPEYYTIWRSQRVSGGAVAGGAAPPTTNGGADIIAEVKVIPMAFGMTTKGYCVAEIKMFSGADAMLVSLLSFLMARW
ncbi:hypothetical protein ABL78_2580 [Leptomonas seymouri]|uniref:Uncharacterized protein n=1 Tax=Leptomonas seymouri TaxID=5684 RepID=A0A0N1PCP4_LEPSE|nr:hypothetical protein ABL78_2580 [Leptomonas seymouri]|eukprot:KPI88341.1 hypothetical protein ABL78_2580 [Leptomonas seymouri]